MRAALIDAATGIDTIRVGEAPIGAPGAGEIQIDVRASSVNFPDILMSEGAYQIKPPMPFTPGMEGAGTVCAVGSDVKDFKVGDRVLASVEFGTFAERLNAPAARCFSIPAAISFETAAAVGLAYQTAHFALCEHSEHHRSERNLVGLFRFAAAQSRELRFGLTQRFAQGFFRRDCAAHVRHELFGAGMRHPRRVAFAVEQRLAEPCRAVHHDRAGAFVCKSVVVRLGGIAGKSECIE